MCVQIEYANNSYLKSHSLSLLLVECPCHLADNYEPTQEKVKVEGMSERTLRTAISRNSLWRYTRSY